MRKNATRPHPVVVCAPLPILVHDSIPGIPSILSRHHLLLVEPVILEAVHLNQGGWGAFLGSDMALTCR